jgi:hypothetical protein
MNSDEQFEEWWKVQEKEYVFLEGTRQYSIIKELVKKAWDESSDHAFQRGQESMY